MKDSGDLSLVLASGFIQRQSISSLIDSLMELTLETLSAHLAAYSHLIPSL